MLTLFFTVLGAAFGVGQGLYLVWKDAVSPGSPQTFHAWCLCVTCQPAALPPSLHGRCEVFRPLSGTQSCTEPSGPGSPPPSPRPASPGASFVAGPGSAEGGTTLYLLNHTSGLCRAHSVRHRAHRLRRGPSIRAPLSQHRKSLRW